MEENFENNYQEKEKTYDVETEENPDYEDLKKSGIDKNLKIFLITSIIVLVLLLLTLIGYFIYIINNNNGNVSFSFDNSSSNSKISPSSDLESSDESSTKSENPSASIVIEDSPLEGVGMSAEEVYNEVSPKVVGVVAYGSEASITSDPKGQGSGIIVSSDGYVVTNSHVISNTKQNNVKIVLSSGEEFSGKIVGYDVKTDLAVIKVEKTGLPAATFGNSDNVRIGQWALALGNPIGLTNSLTRGTISAMNRSLGTSKQHFVKYIQTDAAINPGNSGGPLLNMYGQVIGITTTKIVEGSPEGIIGGSTTIEGVGFAIPSNTVKAVVDGLISKGYVSGRIKLGFSGKMVSHYQSQMYDVPIGVIVSEISKESDLSSKGVQVGDIITKINGLNITNIEVYYGVLSGSGLKAGDSVEIEIYRPATNKLNSSTFVTNIKLLEDKGE